MKQEPAALMITMFSLAKHAAELIVANDTGKPDDELAREDIEKAESPKVLFPGVSNVITFGPLINTGVLKLVDLE
jgi:hypothetical protein